MALWARALGDVRHGDTVATILGRNKGMGPGFEVLRIVLAVGVLITHMKWITGSKDVNDIGAIRSITGAAARSGYALARNLPEPRFFYPMMYDHSPLHHAIRITIVPMFFALSGFLVTGSALRLRSVPTFIAFRLLRIVPALSVEITLSALVLGPILTTFPLKQYFNDALLYSYFFNIVGDVHYLLPGLYVNNPMRVVNSNLWTLPGEFLCYAAMAFIMATKLMYSRKALTITFCVATAVLAVMATLFRYGAGDDVWPVNALAMFFLAGVVLYQWRELCLIRLDLFVAAAIASLVMISSPSLIYFAPLPVAYCAVCVGMYRFPKYRPITSGDYSYGIYLYASPLTQAMVCVFPVLRGHATMTMLPAILLAYGFAFFSWHVIEKPALALKTHLPERWFPRHKRIIPPSIGVVDDDVRLADGAQTSHA